MLLFSKNNYMPTLSTYKIWSTKRIFLIFFYEPKWIFEADRMNLSEFALKLTGKSYFTCVGVWTPKLRNYIISRKTLLSFVKQHYNWKIIYEKLIYNYFGAAGAENFQYKNQKYVDFSLKFIKIQSKNPTNNAQESKKSACGGPNTIG